MSDDIRPFRIDIPDADLDDLRDRLRRTRWPEPEPVADWSQGTPLAYARELCDYWRTGYDWRAAEARLNGFPQFRTEIYGVDIHFLHVRSPHQNALPLLMTHGWPGSVVEFGKVIGPLTDPERYGGDRADAFHLVCPSLPGYGFSGKPDRPGWGVQHIADAWAELMGRLGYQRYAAQGGDWGATVTTALAIRHPGPLAGIHLNMVIAFPDRAARGSEALTPQEQAALASLAHYDQEDSGYSKQQSTRPQTIGYGLVDSPAALCAWIVEKFWSWTDCDGDPATVLTRDEMLDNIMLYWLPGTGASAARLYWESFRKPLPGLVTVPAGCSVFPKEIFRPSRRWAEQRFGDLRYWNELDKGGHFAAFEQPGTFVTEVRAARSARYGRISRMSQDADAIVVGAGLAGLVATAELAAAGRRVILVDQEPEASLGGQAFWSFGGLFLVGSPEQRRLGIRDSHELAWQDWLGNAGFDRPEDEWPRRWAEAYVAFAAGEKRSWLRAKGVRFFPVPGWAERGGYGPLGPGNSVPRFHITWGTGPAVIAPFEHAVRAAAGTGQVRLLFRHQVDGLTLAGGTVTGVRGSVLAPSGAARGQASSREVTGDFELRAQAVLVTSGGIGGNHELVRKYWPARLGPPPGHLLSGVPAHVDGRMLDISAAAGAAVINPDRMWHYTEGITNWAPIWPEHGIRILPGPSSLWLDARGRPLPAPLFPGFDTLGTLEHIMSTGYDYTWFLLTEKIIEREFALSGSEQNPDLTGKSIPGLVQRARPGPSGPVAAFMRQGADFVVRDSLPALVAGMNELTGTDLIDLSAVTDLVTARDREVANPFSKDAQLTAVRAARRYRGDRLIRVAKPHRFLDPAAGPLIAVRLHILTRKSLGGLQTNLDGQVLGADGQPVPGLYAAGEVAGFGGGGMHGYRALEGTFLGGCLFSARIAGRHAARALA